MVDSLIPSNDASVGGGTNKTYTRGLQHLAKLIGQWENPRPPKKLSLSSLESAKTNASFSQKENDFGELDRRDLECQL
jgi:hypothetical protein